MEQNISQSDFILHIAKIANDLDIKFPENHYENNVEYYWKNKNQFISVINKKLANDKLKVIWETHINKLKEVENVNEEVVVKRKIVKTSKFSVYDLI